MTQAKCQRCGFDPDLPENSGSRLHQCDYCGVELCSDCYRNAPPGGIWCVSCAAEHDEKRRRKAAE